MNIRAIVAAISLLIPPVAVTQGCGSFHTRSAWPSTTSVVTETARRSRNWRYENTVVVTESGMESFTDFLPIELDDIERLVQERGVQAQR